MGRPYHPYRSKTEYDYAWLLNLRLGAKEIVGWGYERIGIKLADSTFYYPDFFVWGAGFLELHEVKGYDRQGKGWLKFKIAREQCPMFKWVWVEKKKGEWVYK